MLASLSMIYLVQQHPSWCLGDLIAAMPPPVKSMQNKPIPFDFVFGENEADDAVRRAGKAVEDEMSNSAPASHNNDVDQDAHDERAANMQEDAPGESSLDICKAAMTFIGGLEERAKATGNTVAMEHKFTLTALSNFNTRVLAGGPSATPARKLRQLERLERLHLRFDQNRMRKCMLSHYLHRTRRARQAQIARLRAAQVTDDSKWGDTIILLSEPTQMPALGPDENANYIMDAYPREFVDNHMTNVGALKDGKDYLAHTPRQNTTITRALFSSKMHATSGREISWTLAGGLNFEHTDMYLGRCSEGNLVELWGSR